MAENAKPKGFSIVPGKEEPRQIPNEPFVPVIKRLSMSYSAKASMNMRELESRKNDVAAKDKMFLLHPKRV